MVAFQVVLERELNRRTSLCHDDASEMPLGNITAQIHPRMVSPQSGGAQVGMQRILVIVDIERIVLGLGGFTTPGASTVRDCHRDTIGVERIDPSQELRELAEPTTLVGAGGPNKPGA